MQAGQFSDSTSSSGASGVSSLRISEEGSRGTTSSSSGDSRPAIGRGATRGTRDRQDVGFFIRTRPENLTSKKGTEGQKITVTSNYFGLIKKPNWKLLQYRVDFNPPIEMTKVSLHL